MKIYNDIAIAAGDILLPAEGTDISKWSVIACDQFTSEPEYWAKTEEIVGESPSTLRFVLPEVYLGKKEEADKLASISKNIDTYLANNIWQSAREGFIVLDRSTPLHPSRKGLMVAVDLENYKFEPGNKAMIRATEGTVLSRIPPRVKIRANAKVEAPHIMLLIDDPEDTVIGKAWETMSASSDKPCYDSDLMQNSGHITGYFIDSNSSAAEGIVSALTELKSKSADGMLFAVGDGNHSLASAKAHWENVKANLSGDLLNTHPARFALAEVVNIHDKGIDFEPIHRVVFGIKADDFITKTLAYFDGSFVGSKDDMQHVVIVGEDKDVTISIPNPPHSLAVGSIQKMIDEMIEADSSIEVDYIHGDDSVRSLAKGNNTGVMLEAVSKFSFFGTIVKDGVFPRKTFSMGEAFEKRFYLEARKIEL